MRHPARFTHLTIAGDYIHAPVRAGIEEARTVATPWQSYRDLRRRSRDPMQEGQCRSGLAATARDHEKAEARGQWGEDANLQGPGRRVRLPGLTSPLNNRIDTLPIAGRDVSRTAADPFAINCNLPRPARSQGLQLIANPVIRPPILQLIANWRFGGSDNGELSEVIQFRPSADAAELIYEAFAVD
jgi:hypothetical protein